MYFSTETDWYMKWFHAIELKCISILDNYINNTGTLSWASKHVLNDTSA